MQITIQFFSGASFPVEVCPDDTLADVKVAMFEEHYDELKDGGPLDGIPMLLLNFSSGGVLLADGDRLCERNIQEHAVLQAVVSCGALPLPSRRPAHRERQDQMLATWTLARPSPELAQPQPLE